MGHTFSNILVHAVFSTKERRPQIVEALRAPLYAYMAGVAKSEIGFARLIGGVDDHVHALLQVRPDVSVAHAMNRLKSLSSLWVHRTFPQCGDFAWQEGYGVFSVSESKAGDVMRYIQGQAERHKKLTFQEEFLDFLRRHGVEYDPEHVLD